MDIINFFIKLSLGENEKDITEYKKIRLNEKLEEFFRYEENYKINQKYIYESRITTHFSEYYKIISYLTKLSENMYYIGNCNNMWIDIKQMEDEIKLREPLYQNNLMKKSKPIYDKSFGISIIYFCILMIIYQLGIFLWYSYSNYTHTIFEDLKDSPTYLGLRSAIVVGLISLCFLYYYIGQFTIYYYVLYYLFNYIIYYLILIIIEIIILIFVTIIWIVKILFIIVVILPRLLIFFIGFISKLFIAFITLFSKMSSIEDFRLGFNEIRMNSLSNVNESIGLSDLDVFDNLFNIESINLLGGLLSIETGIKAFTYLVKVIVNAIISSLFVVGETSKQVLEDNLDLNYFACDSKSVELEKLIDFNKDKKKPFKQCLSA